jgi:hypothetical protein
MPRRQARVVSDVVPGRGLPALLATVRNAANREDGFAHAPRLLRTSRQPVRSFWIGLGQVRRPLTTSMVGPCDCYAQ